MGINLRTGLCYYYTMYMHRETKPSCMLCLGELWHCTSPVSSLASRRYLPRSLTSGVLCQRTGARPLLLLLLLLLLSTFKYHMEYQAGKEQGNVDALSRLPVGEAHLEVPIPGDTVLMLQMLSYADSVVHQLSGSGPIQTRFCLW